ncbi:hypothetical protein [Desulfopila sp. IMCC35008]|uniref:hypothetical protein n=1 Tax=Desulfopila sp. IMCC35008 TaxID=2653858 RepID=UPI0013D376CD|nr:hypothetical protein [Desulfopila sp. IMCC35008]
MAKSEKLNQKKQSDLLTAHMGLAAEQEKQEREKSEGCLSSEQLADVAANMCTPEQREKAMEHFSSCQVCYDEWVSICFSLMSVETGSSGKTPLVTVRNLGYLGSALAIAASVMLYINISRDIPMQEMVPRPPVQDKSPVQTVPPAEKAKAKALHRPPEAAPAPSVVGESNVPGKMERRAVQSQSREFTDSVPESEVMADQSFAEEGAAEELNSGLQGDNHAEAVSKWLIVVEYGCKTGNSGAPFWQTLYDDGQTLLAGADTSQAALLERVIELLPNSEETSRVKEQCGPILSILAEQGKTQ